MRRSSGGRRSGGSGIGSAFSNILSSIAEYKLPILATTVAGSIAVGILIYLNNQESHQQQQSSDVDFSNSNSNRMSNPKNNSSNNAAASFASGNASRAGSPSGSGAPTGSAPQKIGSSGLKIAEHAKEVAQYLNSASGEIKVPETLPTTADNWYLLGTALLVSADLSLTLSNEDKIKMIREGGKKITMKGKDYRSSDCFAEAIKLDKEHGRAWLGAARSLFAREKHHLQNDTESTEYILINGAKYTGLNATTEAIRLNPHSSEAWCLLGWQITSENSPFAFKNAEYTRKMAFIKAIEMDPSNSSAWLYLGTILPRSNVAYIGKLNNLEVDDVKCYTKAIEADKENHRAWYALGLIIDSDHPVLVNNAPVTDLTCFVNVLNLDASNAEAWYNLGTVMPSGSTVSIQGHEVNEINAFQAALERNPNNGDAWYSLGVCLGDDQGIPVGEGDILMRKDCYIAALAVDETLYRAWYNLALEILEAGDKIQLHDGSEVDELECCAKSVEHNPGFKKGWAMLTKALEGDQTVTVRGKKFGRNECAQMAAGIGGAGPMPAF